MSESPLQSKVRILPELIINKIAAGEVVERPASAVKELIENSIDAGADQILITCKNGGKDLISVLDNGAGMSEEDARLAIERHATSKIYSEDQLNSLTTLGFRGEALASIASVSRFELITCENEEQGATQIQIHGGYLEFIGKAGFPKGTKITIQNLFYNTPARLKFMKTTATEFLHIQEAVIAQAVAHPHIQFRLTHNQQIVINVAKQQSFEERIYHLFGEALYHTLLPVVHEETYLSYQGLLSIPSQPKTSRKWQRLYVNHRSVKSSTLQRGIYGAYRTLLTKQEHPAFFLKVTLDPSEVDVNVHPAKTEVRFRNSRLVQTILSDQMHRTLMEFSKQRFFGKETLKTYRQRELSGQVEMRLPDELSGQKTNHQSNSPHATHGSLSKQRKETLFAKQTKSPNDAPTSHRQESNDVHLGVQNTAPVTKIDTTPQGQNEWKYIGKLQQNFILAENLSGLVIIHQSNAEEVLYYYKLYEQQQKIHQLDVPLLLELTPTFSILLDEHQQSFENVGWKLQSFGRNTWSLSEFPAMVAQTHCLSCIQEALEQMHAFGKRQKPDEILTIIRKATAFFALAKNTGEEEQTNMEHFVHQVAHLQPFIASWEKKVWYLLSQTEVEKRF